MTGINVRSRVSPLRGWAPTLRSYGRGLGPGGWRGFVTLSRIVDSSMVSPIALPQAETLHPYAKERACIVHV